MVTLYTIIVQCVDGVGNLVVNNLPPSSINVLSRMKIIQIWPKSFSLNYMDNTISVLTFTQPTS